MGKIDVFLKEKVLCITNRICISFSKGSINVRETANEKIISTVQIEKGFKRHSIISRLMRTEPRCAVMIDENTCLISHDGTILNYRIDNNALSVEHKYDRGMKNPLCFCCVKNPRNNEKEVYYGEYIWNVNRGPVAIYGRKKGRWLKVFEFPEDTITHIHNIIFDEIKDLFYILTGDSDSDSGIWIADRNFEKVIPLVKGEQKFRACAAFPVDDGLLYATDTPLETNYIYKIILDDSGFKDIEKLCEVPGPCIYGTAMNEEYIFATSVEPDSTLPTWRYRFTRKLGAGVKNRYSYILVVDKNGTIIREYKEKKDAWPIWLFQFGNFMFPYNTSDRLYATTQALQCGHGITIKVGD